MSFFQHLENFNRSETAHKGSVLQEAWSSADNIEKSSRQNEEKSSNETEEEWLHMLCVNGNKISHEAGIKEDFKVYNISIYIYIM